MKPLILRNKPSLAVYTLKVSATGSATTANSVNLPKDRGNLVGIDIYVADNTLANVDGIVFTTGIDGVTVHDSDAAIKYSPIFNLSDSFEQVSATGGSTFNYSIVNDQANAVVFYFCFYYEPVRR